MMTLKQFKNMFAPVAETDPLTELQRLEVEKLEQNSGAIRSMLASRGWKVVDEYFEVNKNFIQNRFKTITTEKELFVLQAELRAQENLITMLKNISSIETHTEMPFEN